jgi:hypothetical protein
VKTVGQIQFQATGEPSLTNAHWYSHALQKPLLDDVYICIELVFASGKVLRIATNDIGVKMKDGKEKFITPALYEEPSVEYSYALMDTNARVKGYSLTIDARHISPMQEILSGHPICGYAEVSLVKKESKLFEYENRFLLLRGEMSGGITFGNDTELIELEITDPKIGNEPLLPRAVIDENTIPTAPPDYVGKRFPQVYYNYDYVPGIRLSSYREGASFMVALGHNYNVTKVWVDGEEKEETDATRGWGVAERYSTNGIPYTAVDFRYTTELWQNETVYASVQSEVKEKKEANLFKVIQDIILENADLGVRGVDYDSIARAESKSPSLTANCLINASEARNMSSALGYIEQTICDSFPMITPFFSGNGIGIIYTDRNYNVITANLVLNQNIFGRTTSIIETPKEDIYNDFCIKYDFNSITNNYEKTLTLNSDRSNFCTVSETKFGVRTMEPIQSVIIKDDNTAGSVINWLASHITLPSYYLEYEGAPELFFQVRLGDVITLTDDKLGFKKEKCTVEKITYSRGRSIIGLRVWVLYRNIIE